MPFHPGGRIREQVVSAVSDAEDEHDLSTLARFDTIAGAASLGELAAGMRRVSRQLGFSHYVYGARVPLPDGDVLQYLFSGYPEAWTQRYQDRRYIAIDPIVEHCLVSNSNLPILWSETMFDSRPRQEFFGDAIDHGVASGLSIPLRGAAGEVALFSLANPDGIAVAQEHQLHSVGVAYILGAYVHQAIKRLVFEPERATSEDVQLSARELECLRRWVAGETADEIGRRLAIAERTVRFHLGNIKRKLRAPTKSQAIARAVQLGLAG